MSRQRPVTKIKCDTCPYCALCEERIRQGLPVQCEAALTVPVVDYYEARAAGYRSVSSRRSLPGAELVYGVVEAREIRPITDRRSWYLMERQPGSGPAVPTIRVVSL